MRAPTLPIGAPVAVFHGDLLQCEIPQQAVELEHPSSRGMPILQTLTSDGKGGKYQALQGQLPPQHHPLHPALLLLEKMNNYSKIIPLLIPNPWDFGPGKSSWEEPASTRKTVQEIINKRDDCLLKYSLCILAVVPLTPFPAALPSPPRSSRQVAALMLAKCWPGSIGSLAPSPGREAVAHRAPPRGH